MLTVYIRDPLPLSNCRSARWATASSRMDLTWMLHVGSPTVFDRAHRLTLNLIRDSPAYRTLTASGFTDPQSMSVESCTSYCNGENSIYAGVENGTDCCECMSRRCPSSQFRVLVLITYLDARLWKCVNFWCNEHLSLAVQFNLRRRL